MRIFEQTVAYEVLLRWFTPSYKHGYFIVMLSIKYLHYVYFVVMLVINILCMMK